MGPKIPVGWKFFKAFVQGARTCDGDGHKAQQATLREERRRSAEVHVQALAQFKKRSGVRASSENRKVHVITARSVQVPR